MMPDVLSTSFQGCQEGSGLAETKILRDLKEK
jgi:hypothetical protein